MVPFTEDEQNMNPGAGDEGTTNNDNKFLGNTIIAAIYRVLF